MAWKRPYTSSKLSSAKRQRYATGTRVAVKARGAVPGMSAAQRGYYRRAGYYKASENEKKFLDQTILDASLTSAATFFNLNIVPQNDTESGRVGRKIFIKNLRLRLSLVLGAATAISNTSETVRCLLVHDKQTNGAQMVATDLLETDSFLSLRNLANQERFNVLYDKTFVIQTSGAAPTGAALGFAVSAKYLKINKKINLSIEYDNSLTTGAVSTQRSNSLWWVTLSRTGALVSTDGLTRIRYND